jgi:hypothetical protein
MMSDAVKIALIAAGAPTIIGILSLFHLRKIHLIINSRMDALLEQGRKQSFRDGEDAANHERDISDEHKRVAELGANSSVPGPDARGHSSP